MHRATRILPLLFLLLGGVPAALAAEITGKVVGITDGDTLTVLDKTHHQVRVRLAEIDAPESHQPFGMRARQILSGLAFSKWVRVVIRGGDRYGRTVGRVYDGANDINAEMVRSGAAWVYRKYNHDPLLLRLEGKARDARRGLWALPEAERIPPWEWRKAARSGLDQPPKVFQSQAAAASVSPGRLACGQKRRCGEMTSCSEARYYLVRCGLSSLDTDRDGIPCENLCR